MKEKTEKQRIGVLGEEIAAKFLVKQGFIILERNFLKKIGEIDLICSKNRKVHFVEVKTVSRETPIVPTRSRTTGQAVSRETSDTYRAEDNIHSTKLKRIKRTIEVYLNERNIDVEWEFHAITVVLDRKQKIAKVRFLRNLII